jgi:hypothetical protein
MFNTIGNIIGAQYIVPTGADLAAATAAYQAVLDEATSQFMTLPTSEEQATHMQLIISLMVVNIWDQLDIFYPMVTNADFATLNWKNPTEYQLVLVNSPTYDSNGFTGDGTSYLSTDWAPNDGVSFTLNEAGIGGYETFNLSEIGFLFGSKGVSAGQDGCQLRTRFSDTALGRLNSTTALSIANTSSLGTWQVNRISSTTINLFKNGSSIGSSSANTTTVRNSYPIYLLGQNNAGTPASLSSRSIKAFWSGASLNGLESILHSIIWNFYTP